MLGTVDRGVALLRQGRGLAPKSPWFHGATQTPILGLLDPDPLACLLACLLQLFLQILSIFFYVAKFANLQES